MVLLAEGDVAHANGLIALQRAMIEEVALGGTWSVMPFEDPTEPSLLASMSVSQYATWVAWLRAVQTVKDRRTTNGAQTGNDPKPRGTPKGGAWQKLSKAQQKVLEKYRASRSSQTIRTMERS